MATLALAHHTGDPLIDRVLLGLVELSGLPHPRPGRRLLPMRQLRQ